MQPPPGLNLPGLPSGFGNYNANPYNQGVRGGGNQGFNLAQTNLQTGLMRNQLAPMFAQMMQQYGGNAGQFFNQLMNLGSPFYKQKQAESFQQGVNAGNQAGAQARQAVGQMGAGATPSGVGAAMMGGMGVGQAQNQAETFLNNLFQNEQMQLMGGQGLMQLAQLFNPSPLLTAQINPSIQQPTNTGAETMAGIGNLMQGFFGGGSPFGK